MKYSQYSSNKKGNSAFYIIIAACLIIIGVAAWFAFSRMNNEPEISSQPQSEIESNRNEYNSNDSSYNETVPNTSSNIISSEIVDESVENEPYPQETEETKSYSMPANGEILKDFSSDTLQYSSTYNDMRIHSAVDIACNEGTVVTACADGKVLSVEESASLGNVITIDHGNGLTVKYAALKDVKVSTGSVVTLGDTLGVVATVPSECADQSHLHIEAYQNGESFSVLDLFE